MNFWKGAHITLRAIEPADAETFYRWNLDTEAARNLEFIWPPTSLAQVRDWAGKESLKELDGDTYLWIMEDAAGTSVGSIRTHNCNQRSGTFMYGLFVAAEHQRMNHASDAIGIILRYYFNELRYQKVTVTVNAYNKASVSLHEKLGFIKEGTGRRMFYSEGEYHDVHWYGMTREEWDAR